MKLNFDKYADGLVPAVVQDERTGTVLMLGFMNGGAVETTIESGKVTFYSRSRQCLWTKGDTSGNYLELRSITADCDSDSLLVMAIPVGPACHTGSPSCFTSEGNSVVPALQQLQQTIEHRLTNLPKGSYVARLADGGVNKVAQKVGEEAVELIIAAKDDDREAFIGEAADLLFHFMILLRLKGVALEDVADLLERRRKRPDVTDGR